MATALTDDNVKELRIKTVLGRLELIIDNENERIGKDVEFDIKASNAHKSRCLYELTMLCKDSAPSELPNGLSTQMKFLKKKLMLNARRLEAHLDAVRTVTDILKTAAREQDGDGTYTQEQFRYGEI